ncbi:chromosome partitioning protein ParA [Croceicoccus estronivorus]|uniref:ParA family protein n=1 Tax=Croceicoccus estronivorus TaxID=1172626 RepID=UPI0008298CD8|nr:ParA family protein [Croceicoccus estronivorus]OCC25712.1 chromosome partitioning protein ParA [Croceicoccus estronivorus]
MPGAPKPPKQSGGGKSGATIAIYSVKGGVGKTTLAANLAWNSAVTSGRRTLLWDLDAASGAGFLLGIDPDAGKAAETVFSKERDPAKLIHHTAYPQLDILPADESLRALDTQLLNIGKRRRLAKLTENLGKDYDRILLDCPPVLNEVSAQVLRAADLVIVPLPPSPLSARALELVVAQVQADGKGHPPILPVHSMLDMRRTLHRQARDANPDWPAIPYASAVEQCAVRQCPVGAFAPNSPAGAGFSKLWLAIEQKLAKVSKAKG